MEKKFRARWLGVIMVLIAAMGFYTLQDAEKVSRTTWQYIYMSVILLGGICSIADNGKENLPKYACFSYFFATILSLIINTFFLKRIGADTFLMVFVLLASITRYGWILGKSSKKEEPNSEESKENCESVALDLLIDRPESTAVVLGANGEAMKLEKVYYTTPGKPKCPICENEDIENNYGPYGDAGKFYNKHKGTPVKCKKCGYQWILVSIRNSVNIPQEKGERESMALDLLVDCETYAELATKADHISSFLDYWETLMFKLEQLSAFEGLVDFKGELPSQSKKRLISEFQTKLQAAIGRHKEKVIFRIKERPMGSSEEVEEFCQDVEKHMTKFSYETASFSEESTNEIQAALTEQRSAFLSNE